MLVRAGVCAPPRVARPGLAGRRRRLQLLLIRRQLPLAKPRVAGSRGEDVRPAPCRPLL